MRRWVLKFGPLFARELRRRRPRLTARWHLDEMAVTIAGRRFWLWRAVDDEGEGHCHTRQEYAVFGGFCSRIEASNCLIFLLAVFGRASGLTTKMRERDNAAGRHEPVS